MRGMRMIGRRSMLAAGALLATTGAIRPASAALPVPPGHSLNFRLVRHGSEIGRHTVSFEQNGDALTVHCAVDATVTLVSVPIVRYQHRVTELWHGDTLVSLSGETIKNGDREWVNARRDSEGLAVTGSKTQRYIAPEGIGGTSYWNQHLLKGPMISCEDGVLLRPKVELHPSEEIPLASGATIPADHYNLSGPFSVDLWYDRAATWASLALTGADGSSVRYERL
jgi:Family of unknown function (DUF6134)